MRFSPKAVGLVSAVVTVLVWTAFIVIARASAARTLTPFDLAFVRFVGAGIVLVPWGVWMVRRQGAPGWLGVSPLSWRLTAMVGATAGLAYSLFAYCGFFFAPAAHASVLMPGSLPLWTTLLAFLILKDPLTPARAAGLALIVLGDLLVGGASLLHAFNGGEVWKGDLLFMSAAFCWGIYGVLARRHALDPVKATIALAVFVCFTYVPLYGALALAGAVPSKLGVASWQEIVFQLVFQGMGSVVISGITFTKMVQHYGPVRSTMTTALVPGLSALGAVVFLGEPLYWNLLAGLVLVTAGVIVGVNAARRAGGAAPGAAQAARP